MKPEERTQNLIYLLGLHGGTAHDACREVGLDPHDFLYSEPAFCYDGPATDFSHGYMDASHNVLSLSTKSGNLQYWLGAISWARNNRDAQP